MDVVLYKWQPLHKELSNLIICIDDIHPEFDKHHDFGSLEENSKLTRITSIALEFSWVKFILFVVPNWRYKGKDAKWPENKFLITNYAKWCEGLTQLLPANVSIGLHGWNHYNNNHYERWKEFYLLESDQIRFRLENMLNTFEKANLTYRKIFRPPGWEFPQEALSLLREFGIHHYAGTYDIKTKISVTAQAKQYGIMGTSLSFLSEYDGIISIPANYDIGWSSDFCLTDLVSIGGLISMTGHITNSCYDYFLGNGPELNTLSRLRKNLQFLSPYYDDKKLISSWTEI